MPQTKAAVYYTSAAGQAAIVGVLAKPSNWKLALDLIAHDDRPSLFSTKATAVDQIPAARRAVASLPLVGRRQKTTPLARFPTIQCDIQRNRHRSHTKGRTRPQEKYYWSSLTERRWVSQKLGQVCRVVWLF